MPLPISASALLRSGAVSSRRITPANRPEQHFNRDVDWRDQGQQPVHPPAWLQEGDWIQKNKYPFPRTQRQILLDTILDRAVKKLLHHWRGLVLDQSVPSSILRSSRSPLIKRTSNNGTNNSLRRLSFSQGGIRSDTFFLFQEFR
jgi:hypothetical protein